MASNWTRPWDSAWPAAVPHSLTYPAQPAWWVLEKNLDRHHDRIAIQVIDHRSGDPGPSLTYGELGDWARRLAARLVRIGVRRGDRVALRLPNSPELIASYFAIWLAGATAVPADSMAAQPEFAHVVDDAQVQLILAGGSGLEVAKRVGEGSGVPVLADLRADGETPVEAVAIDPREDLALLIYTGGTTGEPKGAMLTHTNLVANTLQFATWYQLGDGQEITMAVLPLFHIGGLTGAMLVPLFAGATLLLMERFNPAVVARTVAQWRATRFFGVPTMYIGILDDPEAASADFSTLKASRSGAAPLPAVIKDRFDSLVGHEVLVEAFGLSEASPLALANPVGRSRAGSIGIPLPDTDVRLVDDRGHGGLEGELLLRGPQVMKGYWRRPEATADALKDGWLHTGDVARMDEDGYFYIVDRQKDSINSGGFKIWPREVEEVLYQHPGVDMAAVVGVPDAYRGEAVKAFVVLKPAWRNMATAEDLRTFARNHLAPYKVPRLVEFDETLPLTHQGKVLKRALGAG